MYAWHMLYIYNYLCYVCHVYAMHAIYMYTSHMPLIHSIHIYIYICIYSTVALGLKPTRLITLRSPLLHENASFSRLICNCYLSNSCQYGHAQSSLFGQVNLSECFFPLLLDSSFLYSALPVQSLHITRKPSMTDFNDDDFNPRLVCCGLTGSGAITVHERCSADVGQRFFVEQRYLTQYFQYINSIKFRKREKSLGQLEALAEDWHLGPYAFKHGKAAPTS